MNIKLLLLTISLHSLKKRSENSNVFVKLSSGVITRMKPGVDGEVFAVIEVGENVGMF